MTTYQTAELRRWWHDRKGVICGYVYNDPNAFWDDGDLADIEVVDMVDCGQFYILTSKGVTIFKLSKEDELQKK